MDELKTLNTKYTDEKRKHQLFVEAIRYRNINTAYLYEIGNEVVADDMRVISSLKTSTDCHDCYTLLEIYELGCSFLDCMAAIEEYRECMLGKVNCDVSLAQEKMIEAQSEFIMRRDDFRQNYSRLPDSPKAIHEAFIFALQTAAAHKEEILENQRHEAEDIVANMSSNVTLRMDDRIENNQKLPERVRIARKQDDDAKLEILRDIGIAYIFKNIDVDMRNQGNVLISTNINSMENKEIDDYIVAYIFKFLEAFPLESINVHIFDDNTKFIFKRLNNCFQNERNGDKAKRTVWIHTSLKDLTTIRDIYCEDIVNKIITQGSPDLYSIYEKDRSDPFILVILRDGLLDGNGYASSEVLNMINALTDPSETGHRCGIRFLIVDNSLSFESSQTPGNKQLLDSIRTNCNLVLQYDGTKGFSHLGKPVEVLHVEGNIDAYVQGRSNILIQAINEREKKIITIDDVSAKESGAQMENIMYIPVGKSGIDTVELPLSCKEDGGSVAGQCIGYIAIGQSGSGKSSFFHSLVLNGCMKYSPRDLQFWLLDFKNGGASSKYSNSGIPHIKIIAENNRIDDALCLFQMILEEMERRTKTFNDNFSNDIVEYNKKAEEKGLEYFPRIIIAIDEVQEIFREDNASEIKNLISAISSRMRSAGMHFVMVAQNLSEGKSYMIKESFMHSASGRICFRVALDAIRDSGYGEDFIQRSSEIFELKAGEAYISYGPETIKKVKMAYVTTEEMSEKVFSDICRKYSGFENLKPKVIGSRIRLSILSKLQGVQGAYLDAFNEIDEKGGIYDSLVGEDVYRMSPFHIHFSQDENSSVLVLGSDKMLSSSICTSIALSLMRQKVTLHLFNSDISKMKVGAERIPHSFMYFCQSINENQTVENHKMNQLTDVMRELYTEYLSRQNDAQRAEDEELQFAPIFLIIHDLFGIESFINNEIVESENKSDAEFNNSSAGFNLDFSILSDQPNVSAQKEGQFRESIQSIIVNLLKNGYRYNMHLILAIKGDPSTWRMGRVLSNVNNVLLFNDTDYVDQIDNSYYLKEMLKNIMNEGKDETLAVWIRKKAFSKIRPITYNLMVTDEKEALDRLLVKREMEV